MSHYTGSPGGSGNPPGKHQKTYTRTKTDEADNFLNNKSYRGNMHVGINSSAKEVGNQPKESRTDSLEKHAKGPALP